MLVTQQPAKIQYTLQTPESLLLLFVHSEWEVYNKADR